MINKPATLLSSILVFHFLSSVSLAQTPAPTPSETPKAAVTKMTKEEFNRQIQGSLQQGQSGGASQAIAASAILPAEVVSYQREAQSRIKGSWAWTDHTVKLSASVVITLEQDGRIVEAKINKSSGNSEFDAAAVATVMKSSPLPKPPEQYFSMVRSLRFWFDSSEPKT